MSYDFMIMKPKAAMGEIVTMEDLGEHALLRQDPSAVVEALSSLFPELAWREETDGGWFGSLQGDDTWYEFRIGAEPDFAWSVCASHHAATRSLIPIICDTLGLLAFDGQVNALIWPGPAGEAGRG
ncbi:MAG TPA: hypothetical protein VKR55_22740 [Bradyrhizobium sp.]|uniref:hypothetical protein n=1 Tax=Bradyrhizobium sp. TaxID=376 RepID=UPI002CB3360C|nr:hypothetical protein [Bradyrhizobium sp.]HLZ04955.1 hypothetical protein [Bradyrhizobium sp.]